MPIAFQVAEVAEAADRLRAAASQTGSALSDQFDMWAESVADIMHEEIPEDSGDTRESVTIERHGPLTATIGPTNTDDAGRPIGFFINYGAGAKDPNDFIGRTAEQASDAVDINLDGVL